ncbi:MAG TPA: Fe-S cluster assembly ATPase SufC [Chloroflexota bacterium]|nr:Fe-S cluster assembly ATPase SufC [Chloroflexota bacterium]
MSDTLVIKNLHVSVEDREILRGINLTVPRGETHALMGPNGSGKSTLAYTLLGHPKYKVTAGKVLWKGQDILALTPDQRAKSGLFLAFQYPVTVPGVTLVNFLRQSLRAVRGKDVAVRDFRKDLQDNMKVLKMDNQFISRYVNDGFSGGEKKRAEMLQMALLKPEMAILDETDSGLDIDALRIVAEGVNSLAGPELGILIITHYQRILNYITPQHVHVLYHGRIIVSGGPELVSRLEAEGYDNIIKEYAPAEAEAELVTA